MHRRRPVVACPPIIHYAEDGEQETFVKHRLLGYGGSAAVYEVERVSDGCRLAAKVLPLSALADPNKLRRVQNEIDINQLLHHPHVVTFLGSFQDDQNVYLLQELCCITLCEMLKHVGRMSEPQSALILWQVLSALEHLHGCGVAHRDLKLSNMFLGRDGAVKVGDLGLACHLPTPHARRRSTCGSLNWMAPEVLRPGPAGYGLEVDIWALGVMLYTLLVGRPPFASAAGGGSRGGAVNGNGNGIAGEAELTAAAAPPPQVQTTYGRILQGLYRLPEQGEVPLRPEVRSLIAELLVVDPAARPSLAQVRRHAFFAVHLTPGPLAAAPPPLAAEAHLEHPQRAGEQEQEEQRVQPEHLGLSDAGGSGTSIEASLDPMLLVQEGLMAAVEAAVAKRGGGGGFRRVDESTSGSYMELSHSEQFSALTSITTSAFLDETPPGVALQEGLGAVNSVLPPPPQFGPLPHDLTRCPRPHMHPHHRGSVDSAHPTQQHCHQQQQAKSQQAQPAPYPYKLLMHGSVPGSACRMSSPSRCDSELAASKCGSGCACGCGCAQSAQHVTPGCCWSTHRQRSNSHQHPASQHPSQPQNQQRLQALIPQLSCSSVDTAEAAPSNNRVVPGAGADQDLHLSHGGLGPDSGSDLAAAVAATASRWDAGAGQDAASSCGSAAARTSADCQQLLRSSSCNNSPSLSPPPRSRQSSTNLATSPHPPLHPLALPQQPGLQRRRRATAGSSVGRPTCLSGSATAAGAAPTGSSGTGAEAVGMRLTATGPPLVSAAFYSHHPVASSSRRCSHPSRSGTSRSGLRFASALRSVPSGFGLGDGDAENDGSSDTIRSYADSLEAMLLGGDGGRNAAAHARRGPAPVAPSAAAAAKLLPPSVAALAAPVILRHGRGSAGGPASRGTSAGQRMLMDSCTTPSGSGLMGMPPPLRQSTCPLSMRSAICYRHVGPGHGRMSLPAAATVGEASELDVESELASSRFAAGGGFPAQVLAALVSESEGSNAAARGGTGWHAAAGAPAPAASFLATSAPHMVAVHPLHDSRPPSLAVTPSQVAALQAPNSPELYCDLPSHGSPGALEFDGGSSVSVSIAWGESWAHPQADSVYAAAAAPDQTAVELQFRPLALPRSFDRDNDTMRGAQPPRRSRDQQHPQQLQRQQQDPNRGFSSDAGMAVQGVRGPHSGPAEPSSPSPQQTQPAPVHPWRAMALAQKQQQAARLEALQREEELQGARDEDIWGDSSGSVGDAAGRTTARARSASSAVTRTVGARAAAAATAASSSSPLPSVAAVAARQPGADGSRLPGGGSAAAGSLGRQEELGASKVAAVEEPWTASAVGVVRKASAMEARNTGRASAGSAAAIPTGQVYQLMDRGLPATPLTRTAAANLPASIPRDRTCVGVQESSGRQQQQEPHNADGGGAADGGAAATASGATSGRAGGGGGSLCPHQVRASLEVELVLRHLESCDVDDCMPLAFTAAGALATIDGTPLALGPLGACVPSGFSERLPGCSGRGMLGVSADDVGGRSEQERPVAAKPASAVVASSEVHKAGGVQVQSPGGTGVEGGRGRSSVGVSTSAAVCSTAAVAAGAAGGAYERSGSGKAFQQAAASGWRVWPPPLFQSHPQPQPAEQQQLPLKAAAPPPPLPARPSSDNQEDIPRPILPLECDTCSPFGSEYGHQQQQQRAQQHSLQQPIAEDSSAKAPHCAPASTGPVANDADEKLSTPPQAPHASATITTTTSNISSTSSGAMQVASPASGAGGTCGSSANVPLPASGSGSGIRPQSMTLPSAPSWPPSSNSVATSTLAAVASEQVPEMDPEALAELASRLRSRSRSLKDCMAGSRNGSFSYRPSRMMPATLRSPRAGGGFIAATAGATTTGGNYAAVITSNAAGSSSRPSSSTYRFETSTATAAQATALPSAVAAAAVALEPLPSSSSEAVPPGLAQLREAQAVQEEAQINPREVLMVKWLDYSSKYGLSYLLSNGTVGVLFRDGTQMVQERGCAYAWLLGASTQHTTAATFRSGSLGRLQPLPLKAQPILADSAAAPAAASPSSSAVTATSPRQHDVAKKLRLLRSFGSMLLGSAEGVGAERHSSNTVGGGEAGPDGQQAAAEGDAGPPPAPPSQPPAVYVTWWTHTPKALVVYTSSGTLQALFCDGSELSVRKADDQVDFLARDGRRHACSLRAARIAGPTNSITKRLQYAMTLLHSRGSSSSRQHV